MSCGFTASDTSGIGPVVWGSDGPRGDALKAVGRDGKIQQEGQTVFRWATTALAPVALEACRRAGVEPSDLAAFVPHQANLRIIEAVAHRMSLPIERFMVNLDRYGNTSAAAVAIALDEAHRTGRMQVGDYVLLVVFGGGLTWASSVIQW